MPDPISTKPEAQVVVDQARLAAEAKLLSPLKVWAIATASGVQLIDLDTDEHRRRHGQPPTIKSGLFSFTEHDSFITYVNLHEQSGRTTLFANREAGTIEAVFDDHAAGDQSRAEESLAGWGRHRARLSLTPTTAWLAWTAISGQPQSQLEFAEFLEDHASDIREPQAAELLEVTTTISATSGAVIKAARRLDNGQVQFAYEETIEARAGQAGTLQIPQRIVLGLSPYEGIDPFRVEARLRYRLNSGALRFTVLLDQPNEIQRAAFAHVLSQVAESLDLPILHGAAPVL